MLANVCLPASRPIIRHLSTSLSIAGVLLVVGVSLPGCQKPPTTTADEILDYIRNASAGADVRRLDPLAHEYVVSVMKAYGDWKKISAPIDALANLDALWPIDDDNWRDDEALTKRLEDVENWIAGKPGKPAKDDKKDDRSLVERRETLIIAIKQVPGRFDVDASLITSTIEAEFALDARTGFLNEIASRYQRILKLAKTESESLDPNGKGLAFKSGDLTERAKEIWDDLHKRLTEDHEVKMGEARTWLEEGEARRDETIKEKQALRKAENLSEDDWRRYRKLELLIRYSDAKIKAARKLIGKSQAKESK